MIRVARIITHKPGSIGEITQRGRINFTSRQ